MGASSSNLTLQNAADRLLSHHIAPSDNAFWSELLAIPNSTDDVWKVFSFEFLRRLMKDRPLNFASLLKLLLSTISLISQADLSQAHSASADTNSTASADNDESLRTRHGTLSAAQRKHVQENSKLLLNCIRVLTRLISCIQEQSEDYHSHLQRQRLDLHQDSQQQHDDESDSSNATFLQFIWGGTVPNLDALLQQYRVAPSGELLDPNDATAGVVVQPTDVESTTQHNNSKSLSAAYAEKSQSSIASPAKPQPLNSSASSTASSSSATAGDWFQGTLSQTGESLAVAMMRLLTECLHLETFTIGQPQLNVINSAGIALGRLWEPQPYQSSETIGLTKQQQQLHLHHASTLTATQRCQFDSNRAEILRCMLTAVCGSVFLPIRQFVPQDNRFVQLLTDSRVCPLSQTLFYSLLNCVLNYDASLSLLPALTASGTEQRTPLVELSIQVLLVVLDCTKFKPESDGDEASHNNSNDLGANVLHAHRTTALSAANALYSDEAALAERTSIAESEEAQLPVDSSDGGSLLLSPGMAALKAKYLHHQLHLDDVKKLDLNDEKQDASADSQQESGQSSNRSSQNSTIVHALDEASQQASQSQSPVNATSLNSSSNANSKHKKSVTFAVDPLHANSPKVEVISTKLTNSASSGKRESITKDTHHEERSNEQQQESTDDDEEDQSDTESESEYDPINGWSETLSGLSGRSLTSIYQQITRLLLQSVSQSQSLLSSASSRPLDFVPELYVLLWKLLDSNPLFMSHIMSHAHECPIFTLLTTLLVHVYQSRSDTSAMGLMYVAIFLCLKLSGSREFAMQLNQQYPFIAPISSGSAVSASIAQQSMPLMSLQLLTLLDIAPLMKNVPASADTVLTYADLLLLTSHSLIVNSAPQNDALLKVILTQLNNVSPYLTRLNIVTCTKLCHLVEVFSTKTFLKQSKQHISYLGLVLDIINSLIQHQSQGCQHLIYAIVRRSNLFYDMTQTAALEAEKKKRIAAAAAAATTTSDGATDEAALSPDADSADDDSNEVGPVTATWLARRRGDLPLSIILRLLDFFLPLISRFVSHAGVQRDESNILQLIRQSTLVGVLPLPVQIVVRRYIANESTNNWTSTYLYGLVFLRNQQTSTLLFDGSKIKLFLISTQPQQEDSQESHDESELPEFMEDSQVNSETEDR